MIAHHADGFDRQKHSKGLPDGIIKPRLADLVEIDRICLAQNIAAFLCDLARNANRKARPWKGMPPNKDIGQAQLAAQIADLILEQFAQWLDQLHVHPLGQTANIVMAFDRDRWPASERDALNHIGIERALRKEIRPADFGSLSLEQIDKRSADEFALLLWIGETRKPAQELFLGIHGHKRDVVVIAKQADDFIGLVHAHQPVINEDAGQLIADSLVDEDSGNRAIDPAR